MNLITTLLQDFRNEQKIARHELLKEIEVLPFNVLADGHHLSGFKEIHGRFEIHPDLFNTEADMFADFSRKMTEVVVQVDQLMANEGFRDPQNLLFLSNDPCYLKNVQIPDGTFWTAELFPILEIPVGVVEFGSLSSNGRKLEFLFKFNTFKIKIEKYGF